LFLPFSSTQQSAPLNSTRAELAANSIDGLIQSLLPLSAVEEVTLDYGSAGQAGGSFSLFQRICHLGHGTVGHAAFVRDGLERHPRPHTHHAAVHVPVR